MAEARLKLEGKERANDNKKNKRRKTGSSYML